MFRPRIIPILLLKDAGLVKTVQFNKTTYIGDPINAMHIFNDMKADELIFLDISASPEKRKLNFDLIKKIGDEAYMPFAVGGNLSCSDDIKKCMNAGADKVVLNTAIYNNPTLIESIAAQYGKQSIVASIDVKKNWRGRYQVYVNGGQLNTKLTPIEYAVRAESLGAGELMINSINNDGMMKGYDIELIKSITDEVEVPVIAAGGAGSLMDFKKAVMEGFASAAGAGSLFVYHGARKGILINYPDEVALQKLFEAPDTNE